MEKERERERWGVSRFQDEGDFTSWRHGSWDVCAIHILLFLTRECSRAHSPECVLQMGGECGGGAVMACEMNEVTGRAIESAVKRASPPLMDTCH